MTDEEMIRLTIGVAELLGWTEIERFDGSGWPSGVMPGAPAIAGRKPRVSLWYYATDWGAMPAVVEWLRANRALITLSQFANGKWEWQLLYTPDHESLDECDLHDDAPEAVCRAALALAERLKAKPAS